MRVEKPRGPMRESSSLDMADNGARMYDAAAYQAGFALMFAAVAVSLALVALVRESYCRQQS